MLGAFVVNAAADVTNVQIRAEADTDYGTDSVATMISDVLTASDGIATYQVSFDVTPPADRSIKSGISGSLSTDQTWGVGPEDSIFNGDSGDRVESIANLQITNFNANGGELTLDSFFGLTFSSVELANAQVDGRDSVEASVNGGETTDFGSLADNPESIDLEALAEAGVAVTNFTLGTSTTTNLNKWAVNYVEVSVGTAWRADWMRGSWGLFWGPEDLMNGRSETLVDEYNDFLEQLSDLKTIDYIQLHLSGSYIYSPVHMGTNALLESFWQGDTDDAGDPLNLVVPRASSGVDPFGAWATATKAVGLKVQAYVNSSQMLYRSGMSNPDDFSDITARWKNWCDTNTVAQAFLASESYYTEDSDTYTNRPYMFCYAEFILKEYAIQYGDLIDAWAFDSGSYMSSNGDSATNGVAADQEIYQAFADAVHAGNPNAAVAFNNGPERDTEDENPFAEAVLSEDYSFGHPYNGGNNIGSHTIGDPCLYDRNYAFIEKMTETDGNVHEGETTHDWTWDDRIVGHFDPPMSTTAWNAGSTAALTDDEFCLWNLEAMQAGGVISWGAPLNWPNGDGENLLIQDWGIEQLTLMDAYLATNEVTDVPQWARAETPLADGVIGVAYYDLLVEGTDFWDPDGDEIISVSFVSGDEAPSWLALSEDSSANGWRLSGTPNENVSTNYSFRLWVEDASGGSERWVELTVSENSAEFEDEDAGYPVWADNPLVISDSTVGESYTYYLVQGTDFTDYEDDDLTLTKVSGASWLELSEFSSGWWELSGTPASTNAGVESFELSVSDGINSTQTTVQLTIDPAVTNISIQAEASTDYGVDTMATFLSGLQTAYDGLATFQISVDVIPSDGTAIRSGDGGGNTTNYSWGVFSEGETSKARYIFNGNYGDHAESIGNIQVVNFSDGGGGLSIDDIGDLSFHSITVADAQSGGKDSVYVSVGSVSNDLSNLSDSVNEIEFADLDDVDGDVTNFVIGVSSTNSLNKWSVNSIDVSYSILDSDSSYSTWAYIYGLAGYDAVYDSDTSDSDGYNNLLEYALGMNPTNADAGSSESVGTVLEGDTNYFEYIYSRRSDYAEQGLSYDLMDSTNLIESVTFTNAWDDRFIGSVIDDYESVTNRYIADEAIKFIELKILQE